ncbi:MAG: hypothetical protein ACFFC3_09005 [Candidatus Odinarchaeota archaeon]
MKKLNIKNFKSKVIFISLAILSFFLLIINFIPLFGGNVGITTEYLRELELDCITYVNQSNPDMNYFYPSSKYIEFGNSCDVYIHYNLTILPKETDALYLVVNNYNFRWFPSPEVEDVELTLILVESNWIYSEITWNNKPKHEDIIEIFNISEIYQPAWVDYYDLEKTINLTKIFKEKKLSEISFCINITENNPEWDGYFGIGDIRLLYTYEVFIISYTTIISSIIIFVMLIGTFFFIRKDLYSCPDCGTERTIVRKELCPKCGKRITNDSLIRGSYYQLLLILFWLFIFFEGCYLLWALNLIFFPSSLINIPFLLSLLIFPFVIASPPLLLRNIIKYKELKKRIE